MLAFPNLWLSVIPGLTETSDKIQTSYSTTGSDIDGKYLGYGWLGRFPFSMCIISIFCRFTNIFCFNLMCGICFVVVVDSKLCLETGIFKALRSALETFHNVLCMFV